MNARGFSLTELLVSMAIILVLLGAVGAAIVQTLHVQAFHVSRAGTSRTIASLTERLGEEARTATAVFIPTTDVLGQPNSATRGAHEVDFFRRLSAGGDSYVAYRFDAASGDVTRYEYVVAGSSKVVSSTDLAAGDMAAFSAERESVSAAGTLAGARYLSSVTIGYGRPELAGGNDIVVVHAQSLERDGIPSRLATVHLASRAAPTALAILAPKGSSTPPPAIKVFPFVVLRPGFPVTLPHGPMHGGSPGGPPSLIHWVAAAGSVQFYGPSEDAGAGGWFELSSSYSRLTSGVYPFRAADGSSITAVVTCSGGPCPPFAPLPVRASGLAPGSVAFKLIP